MNRKEKEQAIKEVALLEMEGMDRDIVNFGNRLFFGLFALGGFIWLQLIRGTEFTLQFIILFVVAMFIVMGIVIRGEREINRCYATFYKSIRENDLLNLQLTENQHLLVK